MSRKHKKLLDTILRDPIASNLHWRDVESLLVHLGAVIEPSHGARFKVSLNGREFFIHHPEHGNEARRLDVKYLREALLSVGINSAEALDARKGEADEEHEQHEQWGGNNAHASNNSGNYNASHNVRNNNGSNHHSGNNGSNHSNTHRT